MTKLASLSTALVGVLCVLFVVVGISQPAPHPEEYLAVSDKPCEMAQAAQEEAEAVEEEHVEEYYEPIYYSYYDSTYDDMTDQEYIAWRESGADYDARNGQYVGKYQLQEDMLAGDYSPENQEYMAEQYMLDRYGSWEAARTFWDAHGWW